MIEEKLALKTGAKAGTNLTLHALIVDRGIFVGTSGSGRKKRSCSPE